MSNNNWKEELKGWYWKGNIPSAEEVIGWVESKNLLKEASLPVEQEFEALANELAEWSEQTFGKRPASAPVYHLKKEVNELIDALEKDPTNWRAIKTELADCFLLVVDASKKHGLTAAGIISNARGKFEVAKRRSWGKPDENGVVEHIRSEEENNISQLQEVSPASFEGNSIQHGKSMDFGCHILGEIWNGNLLRKPESWYYKGSRASIVDIYKSYLEDIGQLDNQGSTPERSIARDDHRGDGDGKHNNQR